MKRRESVDPGDMNDDRVMDWLRQQRREEIEAEYRAAYQEFPETEEEIAQAEENGRRLVADEPWEKWW